MKVTPSSSARWMVRMDSASSLPAPVYPNDIPIAPRPIRETSRSPNLMCFIGPRLVGGLMDDRHRETVPALGADRLNRRRLQPRVCAHHLEHVAHAAGLQVVVRWVEDTSEASDVVHHDR